MSNRLQPVRIILQSSGLDCSRLRAIANEIFDRMRGRRTIRPRAAANAAEPSDLPSMTLVELCREAIEALGPSRKLYLGRFLKVDSNA
jgi:hypothetical protein